MPGLMPRRARIKTRLYARRIQMKLRGYRRSGGLSIQVTRADGKVEKLGTVSDMFSKKRGWLKNG